MLFERLAFNQGRRRVLRHLVVSIVSTLVEVFVARADARAATLSGSISNPPSASWSKPPIKWSTCAKARVNLTIHYLRAWQAPGLG